MILQLKGQRTLSFNYQTFDRRTFSVDGRSSLRSLRFASDGCRVSGAQSTISTGALSIAPDSSHLSGMVSAGNKSLQLFLLGPFALRDVAGNDLTPRGKKAQALIALLALAPRRQRTRVWLRDKLWSESDERKSSTSLRQVMFELRRDLGGFFDAAFTVTRQTIGLNDDDVWIDYVVIKDDPNVLTPLGVATDVELLEGIDVRDEEFEDWLVLERQIWAEKSPDYFSQLTPKQSEQYRSKAPPPVNVQHAPARVSVGLLPNIQQGSDRNTNHVADRVIEGITKNLNELHNIDIFDLRDPQLSSTSLIGASDADFLIRVRVLQIRQSLTLTFFFYQAHRMSLEWSQSIQTGVDEILNWDSYVLSGFISQNVDRLSKSILEKASVLNDVGASENLVSYTALNMMFRLDRDALDNADQLLTACETPANAGLNASLRSYAAAFRVGENLGSLDRASVADTEQLARHALNNNPFNAISLACLGHAMGYIFQDYGLAGQLLDRALNLNKDQAFVWDHYALHKLYIGDYEAAYDAAKRAVFLGSYSPISYSYDTTLAMTATMLGQHRQAIQSSRSALRKQPKFIAAKRYLLVNYALTGDENRAGETYENLLQSDPAFKDTEVQRFRFRLAEKKKEDDLIQAIRRLTS